MPVRLIAIDLDNTLLTAARQPHPDAVKAINLAMSRGVRIVLASGRLRANMLPFARSAGVNDAIISCNGAVATLPDGTDIVHRGLPIPVLDLVAALAVRQGVHMNAYTRDELFYLHSSDFGVEYAKRSNVVIPALATLDALQQMPLTKVLLMDAPERIARFRRELEPDTIALGGRVTESEADYLEFLGPNVSKASALREVAGHFGIAQIDVAAVGDYLNDLEMIQWAGFGGAMANGHPLVREHAQVTVATNEAGGVAEFVTLALERP